MYKYKDYEYTLEEIQEAADKENLSVDEYIKEYDIELVSTADEAEVAEEVITDPTKEGKKKPTTEKGATVVEETVALEPTTATEFKPVTISLDLPEVKTGTVESTEEVDKIYEKATEEVPEALDKVLKAREEISTDEIKDQEASLYFNLLEVNKEIEQAIPTGFGTQSVSKTVPTQEQKEQRIYNNGLNMPNATPKSAQEYLDTYKNYIKTGKLTPTDNQKEYLAKVQGIAKYQLFTAKGEEVTGEYSEVTQGIVENLINKNKDFKTEKEVNFYIDESSKMFSNREKKFTKDLQQFNINVNKLKGDINFIDKGLKNLNKKNNNFQNPSEYTQDDVNKYNTLIEQRDSLIKSPQAQAIEVQKLNLSQEESSLIDFQNTVTNKVLKFENEEYALKALEKDYNFSTRAALKMEQAFGGFGATSLAMLAKVGAELMTPGQYGDGFSTVALDEKRDNTLIKIANNFLTSAIDYNRALEEKIAKVLPTSVTVKQVAEGKVSFGRFLSEAIANGSPTLVATLGPAGVVKLGSSLAGQAILKPALSRAAANLSAVLLANQAGGGEMSSLLIAREDAPLKIAQLEETLKSTKDPVEIQKINNEIADLEDSMNLSTAKIGFAGVMSAGIEGFTERFGTLALINKATPYIPGQSTLKKILVGGKTFSKGLLQENIEEVIAGVSNNILVQNALLKRNVNVFEGVDLDMIANTTVVSAVMLGQGLGANTRSAFLELTVNNEEASRFQSLTRKLIDLQSSNSTDKRKQTKEILQQLGLENMVSLSKLNTMTPQELQELGNIQTQINKLNREANTFGTSVSQTGEINASDRNTLKKMEQEFEVLRSQKNNLLKTQRGGLSAIKVKEQSVDQKIQNPNFNFYNGAYNAFKVLTENMMPRGGKYIEFEKPEDLNFTEEQKQDFLENYNKGEKKVNKVKTFEEAVMRPNAWQEGNNIYVNLNGIYQEIAQNNTTSASFAVASPLHELSHIRNSNLKLDKRLVNSAVDDAIKIIEANKDNLNKKDYESILSRFKQYQNTGAKYEEFMQVLSDAQTTGLINLSDYIDINSFKDLIKYTGAKAFGDLSEIFFKIETSNDVFNYINSYRTIVKKGTRIGSGDKEETETVIKESKSERASVLEEINKLVPQDITTQEDYQNFLNDRRAFPKLYSAINEQGGVINNYIKSISTTPEEAQKTIENLTNRILKFNPETKRKDGTPVGVKAFGERIFADVQFAKLGSKKELFQESEKTKKESRIEDREDGFEAEAAPEVETEAVEKTPAKKLKEVKETLSEENKTALKDVVAKLELTEDQLTFKKLPNAAIEIFAKQIGIPAKKFDGKANFTRNELDKVINFIEENIDTIRQALPEAAIAEGSPVSENLIGTATGVPTNLLKDSNLYTRQDRGTRLSGLIAYIKNKGIDNSSILKAIGNVDGRRMASPRDKAAQTAKGLINVLAKFATNQEVRLQKNLTAQQATNIEVGKGSKILFSLNTKGNGKWVQNPLNPLDNKSKIYSFKVGDIDYEIKTSQQSFEDNAYSFELFDGNEFEEEFINSIANDDKSLSLLFSDKDNQATQITGAALGGLTNQFKVFGIVANSTIDLIKKEKLNSITFSGKEENRQRLYGAMVQKFKKELGWESYNYELEEGYGEAYIVYDPKAFINPETAVTTEKESRILYSKNISENERKKRNKILIDESTKAFKNNISFDEYLKSIRPVLQSNKVTKALSDSRNKSFRGNIYEYYIWERLNSLNINDLKLMPPEYGTGTDIKATFSDQSFNLEVKLNLQDAFGAPTIYFDSGKNKWSFDESNLDQEIFDIAEKNIDQQKIKNFLTEIQKLGAYSLDETGNKKEKVDFTLRIPAESYQKNKNKPKTGKIDKLTASVYKKIDGKELNKKEKQSLNNAIIEYYNKKNINYIIINNQMYYLKENPLQLPVNQLTGDVYIKFRIKPGGQKKPEFSENFYNLMAVTQFGMDKATSKGTSLNKAFQTKLSKSTLQAAKNNNSKLPKSEQFPKSWWLSDAVTSGPSKMVLDRLKKVDDKNNEARIKFSKSQDLDDTFNKIIENKTGIATYQRFDKAGAAVKGASKGKFNFFIPPSAEDFVGLLYKTLGKGKVGDSQMQFYKDNLLDPYGRAMNDVSSARVAMFEDYKTLKEDLKIIPKDLNKKSVEEYTKEQAVRVYIWNQQENKIPGIFKTNQQKLVDYVNENPDLKTFADQLMAMQKGDGYVTPKEGWLAGTITTDLLDSVNSIKRKKYLEQWQTNVDEMFGESNMNKLEAAFGKPYRRALEDALSRMKSGRNKKFTTGNEQVDSWTNWVNNSVGTIMFLNSRSAILQTLSTVNFINFEDNNIFKAGAAFANQPQYWKDFKFLFNSDFLKERRGGLKFNVSESEIADAAKKGGARGVVSKILQAGFLPTQMADSFAIAAGGATFYRNRLNTYLKQTDAEGNKLYTEAEAQEKTFLDFRETAEETQQSSRPDRISMEQAGPLGRTILAFANTPGQYTRKMKKAALDIKNGRGSLKANISRLIYYGVAQNIIFGAAQAAMFSLAFGDGDEEDQLFEEKAMRIANGTADSILRGAGLYGAIAATIKNTAIKLIKESKKSRTDYFEAGLVELAGISPPIQSKVKKWRSAAKSYEYNKKEMAAKGFSLDSPSYLAGANVIAAFTNLPTDRVVKKVTNVYDAMQEDVEVWKRTALLMGWSKWELEPTVKKSKKSKLKIRKIKSKRIKGKTIKSKIIR